MGDREKSSQMPHLFTVRWPLFARMEAILFFPFAMRFASETEPVRTYVENGLVPAVSRVCVPMGMSDNVIFWFAVSLVVIVPYVFALLVADRFLTIRKGYALLSVFAIAVWAGTALRLAWLLIRIRAGGSLAGTDRLSFDQEAALAVGALALLLHLRPLWIGLRDDGEVAMGLLATRRATCLPAPGGACTGFVLPTDGGLPGVAGPQQQTRAPRPQAKFRGQGSVHDHLDRRDLGTWARLTWTANGFSIFGNGIGEQIASGVKRVR